MDAIGWVAIVGATCLHTRNHSTKEVEQKSKKQRELLILEKIIRLA
jgi:hypothetical protein